MLSFNDYLGALPEAERRALPVDLTLGCGWLQVAERLHRDSPSAAAMLGRLGIAHAALHAALAILDPAAAPDAGRAPPTPPDTLPSGWDALVGDGRRDVVGALVAIAAEMARDAVAAISADADVAIVRVLVRDALDMLGKARDDALGTT